MASKAGNNKGASHVKFRIDSRAIASLLGKLTALDKKVARRAVRKGLGEASKLVMWTAKSLVPKRTGALRKSIGRKIWVKKGGGAVAAIIGPRRGYRIMYLGKPVNPVHYAHLVEFGRREVVAGTAKGKATGKKLLSSGKDGGRVFGTKVRAVPPRPFMRPAWERNKARITGVIIQALVNGIRTYYARGPVKFRALEK